MPTIELNRRFLFILIGVCVFSLAAIIVDIKRSEPKGLEILSLEQASQQSASGSSGAISDEISTSDTKEVDLVPVYLVGAIRDPGIYLVQKGSYLYELVEQAGGLLADAASEEINLALAIQGNCHIRIPTHSEVIDDAAHIQVLQDDMTQESLLTNINTATLEELDQLPGIGPATAKAIIDFRERNGPFAVIDDLMKVSGIKQSRLDAIIDLISVS